VSPVRKVTEFVEKIAGGVLYTNGGGTDWPSEGARFDQESPGSDPKKVPKKRPKLTFVNDQLQK